MHTLAMHTTLGGLLTSLCQEMYIHNQAMVHVIDLTTKPWCMLNNLAVKYVHLTAVQVLCVYLTVVY